LQALEWGFAFTSLLFILTRAYVRFYKLKQRLQLEDYFLLAGWVGSLVLAGFSTNGYLSGMFVPVEELVVTPTMAKVSC
jgi:hypothetical protein